MNRKKTLEDYQEIKNNPEKDKNLVQTGRYLLNKLNMDRLQRDLRNHPEYVQLVSYIQKLMDRQSMQIKRLKRKVILLKDKNKLINIEQSMQIVGKSEKTESNRSEADISDVVDRGLAGQSGETIKCYARLSIVKHPSFSLHLEEKAVLSYVEQYTQTENCMPETNICDGVDPAQSKEYFSIAESPSVVIEKCKLSNVEQSTQTENLTSELDKSDGVDAASWWHSDDTAKSNEQQSIAEQVKQVAENVIADAGMVYVESAGMYYDSKSGYYYSPELGLYYHNTTGCYYYFDKEKNEFSYYSHANTSQQTSQDNQQHTLVQHLSKKKSKSGKKNKKEKRLDKEKKANGKSAKRKALSDPSHNKKIKNDDEKDQGEIPDHKNRRLRENRKKLQIKANDNGDPSEKCHDVNHKKKNKYVEEKVKDSVENRDSVPISGKVVTSEESNALDPDKEVESEVEDGECSSSEAEGEARVECHISASDYSSSASCSSSTSDTSSFDESVAKHHPPCIRIVVKESSLQQLKVGSLYIVTKDGGSLGREGSYHSVIVPDENVSRHHLTFYYDIKNKCYEVVDVGSQNGTVLNGKRMSPAKQESERIKLVHGSTLTVGNTTLLCHVHDGNDTCGHCEPGLIKRDDEEKERKAYKPATNLRKQYKQELQRLRSKYADRAGTAAGGDGDMYTDRAAVRRETVGSTHSAEKTEQGDLHTSITESNKGFKMLEKMGWSKGEGLGKQKQGDAHPVPLLSNEGSSGLGAGGVGVVSVASAMWRPPRRPLVKAVAKVFQQQDDEGDDD